MALAVISTKWRPFMAVMGMAALIAGAGIGNAVAQNAPPQSSGCTSTIISLSPCLSYITGNNTNSGPSQGCCSALGTVVKNYAGCLCQLFESNNPIGVPVNRTRALSLAGACNVKTPPVSQCSGPGPAQSTPSSPRTTADNGNIPLTPLDGSSRGSPAYTPSAMGLFIGLILVKILW